MKKIKILAGCGFGVGSSMVLRMKIDDLMKKHQIAAQVCTADVSTAASEPCDIIFTSKEIGKQLAGKVQVPMIEIQNFLDMKELEEKGLHSVKMLIEKR